MSFGTFNKLSRFFLLSSFNVIVVALIDLTSNTSSENFGSVPFVNTPPILTRTLSPITKSLTVLFSLLLVTLILNIFSKFSGSEASFGDNLSNDACDELLYILSIFPYLYVTSTIANIN